jgi:hypothetical protein
MTHGTLSLPREHFRERGRLGGGLRTIRAPARAHDAVKGSNGPSLTLPVRRDAHEAGTS